MIPLVGWWGVGVRWRSMARILSSLPDNDFDVTEVSVPWRLLTRAGHFFDGGGAHAAGGIHCCSRGS